MMQSRHTVAPPQAEVLTQIVPVMRARVPVRMQLEFPLPDGERPITEQFLGDLLVEYAFDRAEGGLERLAPRHCARLGIEPAELRERAVANLRVRRPEMSFNWYPDARAVSVSAGGDLEAALILDEGFAEKLTQDVDGDLVVAVPARDVFAATGTGHPDGIDKLRWVVDQIWADERYRRPEAEQATGLPPGGVAPGRASLLLTRDLLVRRGNSWEIVT